jgi:hypothetical protein
MEKAPPPGCVFYLAKNILETWFYCLTGVFFSTTKATKVHKGKTKNTFVNLRDPLWWIISLQRRKNKKSFCKERQ